MKNYFITEIASAHMGDIDLVKYITNIHQSSKSNFIKYISDTSNGFNVFSIFS